MGSATQKSARYRQKRYAVKRLLLPAVLVAFIALAIYQLSFFVASEALHPQTDAKSSELESDLPELVRLIDETIIPSVLKESSRIDYGTRTESDDLGSWDVQSQTWQLPVGVSNKALSTRLKQFTNDVAPDAKVYRNRKDELIEIIRIYVGKRLTHQIELIPTLSEILPPAPDKATLVAVAVLDLGQSGAESTTILKKEIPISVGILPYSPFALKQARDAVLQSKEVLVLVKNPIGSSDELLQAILAVPNATGVAIDSPPADLPISELKRKDFYILDIQGQTESAALRKAINSKIPILRVNHRFEEGDELRIRHLARVNPGLIITVSAKDKAATKSLLNWLSNVNPKEVRPVFVSELHSYLGE